MGFGSCTHPIDYELLQHPDFELKETGFSRLELYAKWALKNNLNIVLDLHKTSGFSFDKKEGESGFFCDKVYQDNFCKLWEIIAQRFAQYSNIAFELLNEVTDIQYKDKWNAICERCISGIRKSDPRTLILIGGCNYNNISSVKDLPVLHDDCIVYNFHLYDPLIFTHQGAYWIEQMDEQFRMDFYSSTADYLAFSNQYIGAGHEWNIHPDSIMGEAYFDSLIATAVEVANERNMYLYCGEYGVIDRAHPNERLEYLRCISQVFMKYNIGRALWNYKGLDFGLIDETYDSIRKDVITLL